jgi:hypothetical protein
VGCFHLVKVAGDGRSRGNLRLAFHVATDSDFFTWYWILYGNHYAPKTFHIREQVLLEKSQLDLIIINNQIHCIFVVGWGLHQIYQGKDI